MILALLLLAIGLASLLILLPVLVFRLQLAKSGEPSAAWAAGRPPARFPFYFALIGLAFLFIEIPLIQSFILYLGNPAYAFALVVFSLLASSGVGSLLGRRLPLSTGLALAALFLVLLGFTRPALVAATLGWPPGQRLLLVMLMLTPLGLGMGTAFPGGIVWMSNRPGGAAWIPWMWAINGAASVVSAILAALLALTWGFDLVLALGLSCYLAAWLIVMVTERRSAAGSPSQ